MEIFAHALWTAAAATGAKRKARVPLSTGWTVWWGVFPDLFAFTIPVTAALWYRVTSAPEAAYTGRLPRMPFTRHLYQISHSLIIFLAVFALVWLIARRPMLSLLGWPLHILIDIPSHTARHATPFLWPVSSYRFSGVSWGSRTFMILNYTALAVVWLVLWYTRRRAAKTEFTHAGT